MLEINNTRCSDILWIVNCWASLFSVVVHSSSEVLRARFTIILKTTSCRTWWWWPIFTFTFFLVALLYLFTSKHIMRLGDKWGCLRGTSLDNNRLEDVSKDENGNWIERETIGYCLSKSVEWEAWNSRDNCHRYRLFPSSVSLCPRGQRKRTNNYKIQISKKQKREWESQDVHCNSSDMGCDHPTMETVIKK